MSYKYCCLNPISGVGLEKLTADYERTEDFAAADVAFVRSAKMDEMSPGPGLLAVARAGAGVNNIPLDKCSKQGITERMNGHITVRVGYAADRTLHLHASKP